MLLNTRTYTPNRVQADSVGYAGPANTLSITDTLELKRQFPKPSGVFLGVAKPVAKRVKTVTLAQGGTADAIMMLSGSLPVGIAAADVDALLADMAAFCASNDAKNLFKSLLVNA